MKWAAVRDSLDSVQLILVAGQIVNQAINQLMLFFRSQMAKCRIPRDVHFGEASDHTLDQKIYALMLQIVDSLAFDATGMSVWKTVAVGQEVVVPLRKGPAPIVHKHPKRETGGSPRPAANHGCATRDSDSPTNSRRGVGQEKSYWCAYSSPHPCDPRRSSFRGTTRDRTNF